METKTTKEGLVRCLVPQNQTCDMVQMTFSIDGMSVIMIVMLCDQSFARSLRGLLN
jgi:hypothetical protein